MNNFPLRFISFYSQYKLLHCFFSKYNYTVHLKKMLYLSAMAVDFELRGVVKRKIHPDVTYYLKIIRSNNC